MPYQLVLQFRGDSPVDLRDLAALEESLLEELDGIADVDGHDIGSGEANIFIVTADPRGAFDKAMPLLRQTDRFASMCAAFRDIDGEDYTILWPQDGRSTFSVA